MPESCCALGVTTWYISVMKMADQMESCIVEAVPGVNWEMMENYILKVNLNATSKVANAKLIIEKV